MKKLNNYQACHITRDEDKRYTVTATEPVQAETLAAAYESASGDVVILPMASIVDGDSIQELAQYTVRQFHKWELRNNNAVLSALNRSTWDEEDEHGTAALAILDGLTAEPDMNMFDLYRLAASRLYVERRSLFRKSEAEYNPDRLFCNMEPRAIRETFPGLCGLMRRAKDALTDADELTAAQIDVLEMYGNGISVVDISEKTGKNRKNVYKLLYKAEYKLLLKMAELDGADLDTFTQSGIDRETVLETLETYEKRAKTK